MNRRNFLKGAASAVAMPLLPACFSPGAYTANSKVRLACVGIGNQAWNDIRRFAKSGLCEIVALCDTDLEGRHCAPALSAFPDAPRFTDFRRMLDALGGKVDAVAVMTPDHSHFPALMDAMRRGIAVYSEKPLAHSMREHELLLAQAKKSGVVTQMGNQGHSEANLYQFRHYVESGVIDKSKLTKLVAHMNSDRRWYKFGGKVAGYPAAEELPKGLDWNAWVAGAVYHDYSSAYANGEWRSWYDFGSGCLGDWGAHTMDTMHRFFDLGLPTSVRISDVKGWNSFVFPLQDTLTFSFAAKGTRPAIDLEWREGIANEPELPKGYKKGFSLASGSFLKPGKIIGLSDGTFWQGSSHGSTLFRCGDGYAPDYPAPKTNPDSHYVNFLRSVAGEERPNSPFEVAVPLCEVFSIGIAAQRLNRGFEFDPAAMTAPHDEEAALLLRGPEPRRGWEEFYTVA
ncbi:MAG: Gfo/Idh/MocA family oxidoreductase [Kiritimatiellae bacterium]|nr:Gfo/Idh/MocA family oxidoreductase [Kiritimatiellia bacterium]